MPGFLKSAPVTDAQRRANDRHSWRAVAAVLVVLCAYVVLFTNATQSVGLPAPKDIAQTFGVDDTHIFDQGIIDSSLRFMLLDGMGNADALLVFFAITIVAFLAFYFLPLPYKQPSLLLASLTALGLIYGVPGTAGLLFAHVLSYMVFHPVRRWFYSPLLGALGTIAFAGPDASVAGRLAWFAVLWLSIGVAYRFVIRRLLNKPRAAARLRVITAHSALISVVLLAMFDQVFQSKVILPLGILLFFWHWARLIMYQIDYKDGLVPKTTSLPRYLAVFFTPGVLPSWDWGVEIGLGYAYTNNSFLREDKNRIVMSGVRMLWLAMGYLALGDWARHLLLDGFRALGVEVHNGYIIRMVDHFMQGGEVSPLTVLMNSLLDTLRWTLRFIGIVHFKVGLWRVCGYAFAPYFDRPWLSTNLVVFWARYTYYYREFLLQAFYYPVFLRFFKKRPRLRMVVATVAAAGAGNLIWGHLTDRMYYWGATVDQFGYVLRTWPYYLFLSGAIALTALYLLQYSKRKRRRPWSWSPRLVTDVLASYCTMQYFSIIHIMSRPSSGSNEWDLFRLMLRGFGVYL